jgi:hypothetical protein
MSDDYDVIAAMIPSASALDIVRAWRERVVDEERGASLGAALALAAAARGDVEIAIAILSASVRRNSMQYDTHSALSAMIAWAGDASARLRVTQTLDIAAKYSPDAAQRALDALHGADAARFPGIARVLRRATARHPPLTHHPVVTDFLLACAEEALKERE